MKKIIIIVLCAAALMTTGCSNESEEKQEAYRQYGITCLQDGKYEEAVDYFQKALDQSVGRVSDMEIDICFYKAEALYRGGDTEGALEVYTSIINYNKEAEAYYLRGSLYYSIGTEDEKELGAKDFEEALKQAPEDYELYIGIYETLSGIESEKDRAEGYLQSALEIEGDEAEDHMQKGRIYYLLGDYDQAKTLLEKAVGEKEAEANYYLTEIYEALGDKDAADQAFQTYLESGLADSNGLYAIGTSLMKAGEYTRAISCFDTALGMDNVPNRQAIEKSRIIACENTGDFAAAKKYLEAYGKAYPDDDSMENERIFLETR